MLGYVVRKLTVLTSISTLKLRLFPTNSSKSCRDKIANIYPALKTFGLCQQNNLSTIKSQHNNHTNKVEQMSLGGIYNDIFESAERKKVLSFLSDEHVKRKTNFGDHLHSTSPPPTRGDKPRVFCFILPQIADNQARDWRLVYYITFTRGMQE